MATFTATTPELMEARDKAILFKTYTMQEKSYPKLFQVRPSKKGYEDRMRVRGLGTLQQKPEGTPVAYSDPREGTRRRVVHVTYALGYRITWEAYEDDQFNILSQMPADLGDSLVDHEERIAWDVLNDAFTGARHTNVDGDALFTSHSGLGGFTATSNALSPALALSVTGLETVMTAARTTQSEEGRYINLHRGLLVYHPDNAHNAHVLLNTEMRPGTADNDKSTVVSTRSGISPVEKDGVPYLTSTTQWSVHAAPGKNGLYFNMRAEPRFGRSTDSETFDMKHNVAYRASMQVDDWRPSWGSTGVV